MGKIEKSLFLARIAIRNPLEFFDRLEAVFTSRWEKYFSKKITYPTISSTEATARLMKIFQYAKNMEEEIELIEAEVIKRMRLLEGIAPFTTTHHGDFSLARLCFISCRLLRPDIVIETGVAYGVTTAFILQALQLNGKGILHSIDLPPLGKDVDNFVGYLVPEELKDNWILHRGVSKRVLPKLLSQFGNVDIFIHDSLHTYWNIRSEFRLTTPYLSRPAIVIADDVQDNTAFREWVLETMPATWFTFQELNKNSIAGVAVFR